MTRKPKPFDSLVQYDNCAEEAKQKIHVLDQILDNAENSLLDCSTNDDVVHHWFKYIRRGLRIERLVQDDFREYMRAEVREMRKELDYDYI